MLTRRTLARLNNRRRKVDRVPLAAIGAGSLTFGRILFVLGYSTLLALAARLGGALGGMLAYMAQRARGIVSLTYGDLEGDLAIRFAAVREACKDLASSERIWHLSDSPEQPTMRAGDVSFPPPREAARVGLLETPGIRANI